MHEILPAKGTILAIDYGLQRVGIACGDIELKITHPLFTINQADKTKKIAQIQNYITEWQPILLVMGLPLNSEGQELEMTRVCLNFAEVLLKKFSLPIYLVDERYSSSYAECLLSENKIKGIKQKPYLDQVAAQAILLSFFIDGFSKKLLPID